MNNRLIKRYSLYIETTVGLGDQRVEGVAVNFSSKGVGVCSLASLGAKADIALTFYFHDKQVGTLNETIRGVVQWEKKFGKLFMVGVEFSSTLNDEANFLILSHIELAKEFEG